MDQRKIIEGSAVLGAKLSPVQVQQLIHLTRILSQWNRVYNLVGSTREMANTHILDSLSVHEYLYGNHIVDVGSGAGFPGLPLAIANRQKRFVLLDANGKKIRFIRQAIIELEITNVTVQQSRVEDYHGVESFDTVICRAFASLSEFVTTAGHLCSVGGKMLAMKGCFPTQELERIPAGFQAIKTLPVVVPGIVAQRHIIEMTRA